MDVWAEVAAGRVRLADQLGEADPARFDEPSWCEGWRIRDVVGHLVYLAEGSQLRVLRDIARHGPSPDKAVASAARTLGELPAEELLTRLRAGAGGRFHVTGSPRSVALAEVLVHSEDVLRPLGIAQTVDPALPAACAGFYRRIGRVAFHAAPAARVTLVATDTDLRLGSGPEVEGRAIDLLLLVANRRQVVADLRGPGVAALGV